MKLCTIAIGLLASLAASAAATPTLHAEGELAEHLKAEEAFKTSIQNTDLEKLKDMVGACSASPADVNTSITVDAGNGSANDKVKVLGDALMYVYCGKCGVEYNKYMQTWQCWLSPEACSRTCQCDVLKKMPECKECGFRC